MPLRLDKLTKLQNIYLSRYLPTGESDLPELFKLADEYDIWFMDKYVPFLESQLTISKNVWQSTPDSASITTTAGRLLKNGCARIIVDGVNRWLMTPLDKPKIIEYYRQGVDLWKLNREALGMTYPRKTKLDDRDSNLIQNYLGIFNDTWQNHLNKHIRTVNRFVNTGQLHGWTTEQFVENCTCPNESIIAFRIGDTGGNRQSWRDTIRRFGVARPKILAQAGQAERMGRG